MKRVKNQQRNEMRGTQRERRAGEETEMKLITVKLVAETYRLSIAKGVISYL